MARNYENIDKAMDEMLTPTAEVPASELGIGEAPVEEGVEVAGLLDPIARGVAKAVTGLGKVIPAPEVLKTTKGQRAVDVKVQKKETTLEPTPELDAPESDVTATPMVFPEPEPKVVPPALMDEAEAVAFAAEQEAAIGAPRMAPSPTAQQKRQGVEMGRLNNVYDNEDLAATLKVLADKHVEDFTPTTVAELSAKAAARGIPATHMKNIFSGQGIQAGQIGNQELATRFAGLLDLHDASLELVTDFAKQQRDGLLSSEGKVSFREALSRHIVIVQEVATGRTDVAQTMNVFKRTQAIKEAGKENDLISILDDLGGDDELRVMAEILADASTTAKTKNQAIDAGVFKKLGESGIYILQGSALSNITETPIYNTAAGALLITKESFIDLPLLTAFSGVRTGLKKIIPSSLRKDATEYVPEDQPELRDLSARFTALYEGTIDGMILATKALGQDTGYKNEINRNPLRSTYWANTPVRLLGKEIGRIPKSLPDTLPGAAIDILGDIYGGVMKTVAATDAFVGGIAQRVKMTELLMLEADDVIKAKISAGETHEQAMAAAQAHVSHGMEFRTPDNVVAADEYRKTMTLQYGWDRALQKGTYGGAVRSAWSITERLLDFPLFKFNFLFTKTPLRIVDMALSETPLAPVMSHKFYSDIKKGGRQGQLAYAKIAGGASLGGLAYYLYNQGALVGPGPANPKQAAAWRAQGNQPFTVRIKESKLKEEHVARLKAAFGEEHIFYKAADKFSEEGSYMIKLGRLEPNFATMFSALSYFDYQRFKKDHGDPNEDNSILDGLVFGFASLFEATPVLEKFGQLLQATRPTSDGETTTKALEFMAKTYGSAAYNIGTLGFGNPAIARMWERKLDPLSSNIDMTIEQEKYLEDQFGLDPNNALWRETAKQINQSRNLYLGEKKGLVYKYDQYGQTVGDTKIEDYITIPARQRGTYNELAAMFMFYQHGISSRNLYSVNGIKMSSDEQARYVELYTREISIAKENGRRLSLNEAVAEVIADETDQTRKLGLPLNSNRMRSRMSQEVAKYQKVARERMYGKTSKTIGDVSIYSAVPLNTRQYGLIGDNVIEFPDKALRINSEAR